MLWLDNYGGHLFEGIADILDNLNTTLKFYPPNTTDKLQACDSFPIQKFKELWKQAYSKWRVQAIRDGNYEESGALKRPSREWYLKTIAECVKILNSQFDRHGMTWAHKAMVLTGTGLPLDGVWKVSMLTSGLQEIVKNYPDYFDGKSPYEEQEEEKEKGKKAKAKKTAPKKKKTVFLINFGGMLQQMTMDQYLSNTGFFKRNSKDKEKNEKAREEARKVVTKVQQNFDNESVSHRALLAFLHEAMPNPVPIEMVFAPRPTRFRNATKMLNSIRGHAEIHDLEVVYLWKVVVAAMQRSNNVNQLNYGQLFPTSPRGIALPSADILRTDNNEGTTGQPFITYDHFELLIINTELLDHPITRETGDGVLSASLIHADSLDRRLEEATIEPIEYMNSKMIQDIAQPTGNAVFTVPCVLQPGGSRICGVCTCVNHLLMVTLGKNELIAKDCIEKQLAKYNLPKRREWNAETWARTGAVLAREFLNGRQASLTVTHCCKLFQQQF
jgi:hypothetical protein